jgi:ATP-dependent Zn protease
MGPADIAVTLRILMSGRAAKEVVLGQASSGAGGSEMSDLSSATRLSVLFESAFGFGDTITWLGAPSPADIAAFLAGRPDLAALTEKQLQVALSEALALMRRNRPSLDALTSALLDRKTLNGEEAGAIVAASAADA